MGAQKADLYSLLPDHPKSIYPDWDATQAARESFECSENMLCGWGDGPLSWYGDGFQLPHGCEEFVIEQFHRFKVDLPIRSLIEWCWHTAFYYMDQVDPYMFFYGCCDVIKTEENYFYQYSVSDDTGTVWREVEPGETETFRYYRKGVEAWHTIMGFPGLDSYFEWFHDYFNEQFEMAVDSEPSQFPDEWEFIGKYGEKRAYDLCHLGLWACLMWMCSPMARHWRSQHHPIYEICYEHGECLIHNWCFHSPQYYRREDRPAMTCAICGQSEWCVELVQIQRNDAKYVCEHCLNPVRDEFATCGKRMCTKITCAHPPGQRTARSIAADNRYGALKALPNGRQARELPGVMYLNEKLMDKYSVGIADVVGEDLKKLLTFN